MRVKFSPPMLGNHEPRYQNVFIDMEMIGQFLRTPSGKWSGSIVYGKLKSSTYIRATSLRSFRRKIRHFVRSNPEPIDYIDY